MLGRSGNFPFESYADYLASFDRVWNGEPGQRIREYLRGMDRQEPIEGETRFLRRVLDIYAMQLGERWK
jgi:hypothetical protein